MDYLIVPCYNEQARLDVRNLEMLCDVKSLTVTCVDDGSTDGTLAMLGSLASTRHNLDVFALPKNMGKAEAVRQGMLLAARKGGRWIGYTDADMATPVKEIKRIYGIVESNENLNVVIGARIQRLGAKISRRVTRHYLGRIFSTFASYVLRQPIYDTQCGMKWIRGGAVLEKALALPFVSKWAFDVELLGRIEKAGYGIETFLEVPLEEWNDVDGSKMRLMDMFRAGIDLCRIAKALRKFH